MAGKYAWGLCLSTTQAKSDLHDVDKSTRRLLLDPLTSHPTKDRVLWVKFPLNTASPPAAINHEEPGGHRVIHFCSVCMKAYENCCRHSRRTKRNLLFFYRLNWGHSGESLAANPVPETKMQWSSSLLQNYYHVWQLVIRQTRPKSDQDTQQGKWNININTYAFSIWECATAAKYLAGIPAGKVKVLKHNKHFYKDGFGAQTCSCHSQHCKVSKTARSRERVGAKRRTCTCCAD